MPLLKNETRKIGDYTYTIQVLPLAESRAVYAKVKKVLALKAEPPTKDLGSLSTALGATMCTHMVEQMSEADLDAVVKALSGTTRVDFGDGRELSLGGRDGALTQSECFCGALELMFEWIDACLEVNFSGVLEKMRGASAKLAEGAAEAPTTSA